MRPFYLICSIFAFALAALANDKEVRSSDAPSSPEGSFKKVRVLKPISSTGARLKSASEHLVYGAGSGAVNTVLGPALMLSAGWEGSKYAASKVKENWKKGSYHKAAGQAVMVAARPASSLVTAPAAMIAGIGMAAAGTVGAAGSVLKLAKDAAAKPFRRKESVEQRAARHVENAKKLDKKLESNNAFYTYPLRVQEKVYTAISQDHSGF